MSLSLGGCICFFYSSCRYYRLFLVDHLGIFRWLMMNGLVLHKWKEFVNYSYRSITSNMECIGQSTSDMICLVPFVQ